MVRKGRLWLGEGEGELMVSRGGGRAYGLEREKLW